MKKKIRKHKAPPRKVKENGVTQKAPQNRPKPNERPRLSMFKEKELERAMMTSAIMVAVNARRYKDRREAEKMMEKEPPNESE